MKIIVFELYDFSKLINDPLKQEKMKQNIVVNNLFAEYCSEGFFSTKNPQLPVGPLNYSGRKCASKLFIYK